MQRWTKIDQDACRAHLRPLRERWLRAALLLTVAGGAGLLAACGSDAPDPETLFSRGRYDVGFRQSALTYSRGGTGEPRALPLSVWYPARAEGTEGFARYTTGGVIPVSTTGALSQPPVAPGGPFPVVVYSHGFGGESEHAYPYAELLASNGFVVISPDHVGTTVLDVGAQQATVARWPLDRPLDITAVLDWLEDPTVEALRGQSMTERVMVIGYSVGGYTGYAASGADVDLDALRVVCGAAADCDLLDDPDVVAAYRAGFGDARVAAYVVQAVGRLDFVPLTQIEAIGLPVMMQTGTLDLSAPPAPNVERWESAVANHELWINMPEGAHYSFISTCNDVPPGVLIAVRGDALENGCGDGFIPAEDALEGLAAYAHGFARLHLLGETKWRSVLGGPALRDGFDVTAREP